MPHKPTVTLVPDHSTLLRLAAEADVRRRDFMNSFRAKFPVGADVPGGGKVLQWAADGETLLVGDAWISPDDVITVMRGETEV